MKYLLNSAVVTAPGEYLYRIVPVEAAQAWYRLGEPPVSTIGYAETAEALGQLLGVPVAVDRRNIVMNEGDSALVFRLAFPPGTPRIDPRDKGALGAALLAGHYELGLLSRPVLSRPPAPPAWHARKLLRIIWPLVSQTVPESAPGVTLTWEQRLAVRAVCALLAEAHGLTKEF